MPCVCFCPWLAVGFQENWKRKMSPLWATHCYCWNYIHWIWNSSPCLVSTEQMSVCLEGGTKPPAAKSFMRLEKTVLNLCLGTSTDCSRLTDFHWTRAGQHILLENLSFMSRRLVLPLCFLSCRSTLSGACAVHGLSLFHIPSLRRLLFVQTWLTERVWHTMLLIPCIPHWLSSVLGLH